MANPVLNKVEKDLVVVAIDMKIASLRRAQKSNVSPAFAPVYEQEVTVYTALRLKILALEV